MSSTVMTQAYYEDRRGHLKMSADDRFLLWIPRQPAWIPGPKMILALPVAMLCNPRVNKELHLVVATKQGKSYSFTEVWTGNPETGEVWHRLEHAVEWASSALPAKGLLDLPPELRNRIYDLVLWDENNTDVTRALQVTSALRPPALLQTNRQLRADTSAMWYEQMFYFEIVDYNASTMCRWHRLLEDFGYPTSSSFFRVSGRPDWGALVECCRQYHARKLRTVERVAECELTQVILGALGLTGKLGWHDWTLVQSALDSYRMAAGCADRRWLDD